VDKKAEDKSSNFVVLAIVGIVAVIGLVVMLKGQSAASQQPTVVMPAQVSGGSGGNIAGQGNFGCWLQCVKETNSSMCAGICGY